jgi:hypothetical protein
LTPGTYMETRVHRSSAMPQKRDRVGNKFWN